MEPDVSQSVQDSNSLAVASSSVLSIVQYPEDSEEIDDETTDSEVEKRRETRMRLESIYEKDMDFGSYDSMLHLDYTKFKKCVICQQPITELLIWALNKPHHCKCLTCFVCDKSVAFKKFKITEGKLFMCYKDYYESYQKCRICQKVMGTNKPNDALPFRKLFHEDCFKCPNCFARLNPEYSVELFDEIYCDMCAADIVAKKKILRTHYQALDRVISDVDDAEIEKPKYALEEVPENLKALVEKIVAKNKLSNS